MSSRILKRMLRKRRSLARMKVIVILKIIQGSLSKFVVADAVRTYEFTWAIRKASERARAAKLKAKTTAEAETPAVAETTA
jgi:hypothetical protein